ncbi:hypothetical protein SJDPG4_09250 [Porphyromonas gingivalis SJD4]|nr:hypothetical protein SJDPG4_09250 [Porphyromonas gingivalis SJD4]
MLRLRNFQQSFKQTAEQRLHKLFSQFAGCMSLMEISYGLRSSTGDFPR